MGRFLYADEGPHACEGDGRESLQNGRKIAINILTINQLSGVKSCGCQIFFVTVLHEKERVDRVFTTANRVTAEAT